MKKKIADIWVTALESGEYEQGRGQLRSENKFCCLGVLCNLHAQAHPRIAKKQTHLEQYDGEDDHLPGIVQKWSGIKTEDGTFPTELSPARGATALVDLNDMNEYNFKQIAVFIRANYKSL